MWVVGGLGLCAVGVVWGLWVFACVVCEIMCVCGVFAVCVLCACECFFLLWSVRKCVGLCGVVCVFVVCMCGVCECLFVACDVLGCVCVSLVCEWCV